eukprot:GEMP01084382.1.p1 GENE.GEMP01084382.1~~GEMP01084382.1.p1  ORF type:complete len:132 (+),score=25.25 GEMP01084382.1:299-694(+)
MMKRQPRATRIHGRRQCVEIQAQEAEQAGDDEMDDERKKHAAHGTKMHDHFANYILGKETQDEMEKSDLEVSRQFLAFWRDEKWIHFAPNSWLVEHDMKDADEKITGRLDFAADRRTGRIFASSVNFAASD